MAAWVLKLQHYMTGQVKIYWKMPSKAERCGCVAVLRTEKIFITTIRKTTHQYLQIWTVKTNVPKWKKLQITVIYKAPKMNPFEFVDILMNQLFKIGEEIKTNHLDCGDFNTAIIGESDQKQNLIQSLHALVFELANNPKDFTRVSQSSQSTTELVFWNNTVQTHVHYSSASNHLIEWFHHRIRIHQHNIRL